MFPSLTDDCLLPSVSPSWSTVPLSTVTWHISPYLTIPPLLRIPTYIRYLSRVSTSWSPCCRHTLIRSWGACIMDWHFESNEMLQWSLCMVLSYRASGWIHYISDGDTTRANYISYPCSLVSTCRCHSSVSLKSLSVPPAWQTEVPIFANIPNAASSRLPSPTSRMASSWKRLYLPTSTRHILLYGLYRLCQFGWSSKPYQEPASMLKLIPKITINLHPYLRLYLCIFAMVFVQKSAQISGCIPKRRAEVRDHSHLDTS